MAQPGGLEKHGFRVSKMGCFEPNGTRFVRARFSQAGGFGVDLGLILTIEGFVDQLRAMSGYCLVALGVGRQRPACAV